VRRGDSGSGSALQFAILASYILWRGWRNRIRLSYPAWFDGIGRSYGVCISYGKSTKLRASVPKDAVETECRSWSCQSCYTNVAASWDKGEVFHDALWLSSWRTMFLLQ